ncbi:MAG: competence/damage-inducible protein A [Rhodospirillales bacterium]|nr:competence/damage-inducible protein A [Rhodospirillales bacterium]
MTVHLFNKRELSITGLRLEDVDLDRVSAAVADVLALSPRDVLVVDAHPDHLTLDILSDPDDISRLAGKRRALLESLSRIPGLSVGAEAEIHSEGILGVINLSAGRSATLPAEVSDFGAQLRKTMARKVLVLPTGREIMAGNVTDTNTPFLVDLFAANGYQAKAGSVVDDDIDIAIAALSDAIGRGFGIVVSTGGTGAELKDCMVEAITALSPAAATPYVVRYQKGHGRHHKDGVRIAVGEVEQTILVALTGPHAEVRDAAPVLIDGLRRGIELNSLAENIAAVLSARLHGLGAQSVG